MTTVDHVHELEKTNSTLAQVLMLARATRKSEWCEKDRVYGKIKAMIAKESDLPCSFDDVMWTVTKDMEY